MPAASVVLGLVLVATPAAYCTGQPINSESGVPRYPNGQRVVDGFGKEYYPNGARLTNDYGDEVRYSNGARVRRSPRYWPPTEPPLGDGGPEGAGPGASYGDRRAMLAREPQTPPRPAARGVRRSHRA